MRKLVALVSMILVGVVYGGPAESGGRIVYAVSPTALLDFLATAGVAHVP